MLQFQFASIFFLFSLSLFGGVCGQEYLEDLNLEKIQLFQDKIDTRFIELRTNFKKYNESEIHKHSLEIVMALDKFYKLLGLESKIVQLNSREALEIFPSSSNKLVNKLKEKFEVKSIYVSVYEMLEMYSNGAYSVAQSSLTINPSAAVDLALELKPRTLFHEYRHAYFNSLRNQGVLNSYNRLDVRAVTGVPLHSENIYSRSYSSEEVYTLASDVYWEARNLLKTGNKKKYYSSLKNSANFARKIMSATAEMIDLQKSFIKDFENKNVIRSFNTFIISDKDFAIDFYAPEVAKLHDGKRPYIKQLKNELQSYYTKLESICARNIEDYAKLERSIGSYETQADLEKIFQESSRLKRKLYLDGMTSIKEKASLLQRALNFFN